jgi:hypothetical protein
MFSKTRWNQTLPRAGRNFGIDKSDEFAYENTSFDYEFCPQPRDGCPKTFESNEVL